MGAFEAKVMLGQFAGVVDAFYVYVDDGACGWWLGGVIVEGGRFFVGEDEGGAEKTSYCYNDVEALGVGVGYGGFEGGS